MVKEKSYILSTLHRALNSDHPETLGKYVQLMNHISKNFPIIIPLHPRTKKNLEAFNLKFSENITLIEPVGYLDFLFLLNNCRAVISDSGGVVDESLVLNIPLIIFRNETERIDALKSKNAKLVCPKWKIKKIIQEINQFISEKNISKIKKRILKIDTNVSQKMVRKIEK